MQNAERHASVMGLLRGPFPRVDGVCRGETSAQLPTSVMERFLLGHVNGWTANSGVDANSPKYTDYILRTAQFVSVGESNRHHHYTQRSNSPIPILGSSFCNVREEDRQCHQS
jgi:hypothetical protein